MSLGLVWCPLVYIPLRFRALGMAPCTPFANGDLAEQVGGAVLALFGIVVTVAGLLGLKLHGATGELRRCNKSRRWYLSIVCWCVGQLLQLLAVELATEPVVGAVSTLAVPANALLAWRLLDEPVTQRERLAILVMTLGAGMVVFASPQQARKGMTIAQEGRLITESSWPAIGLLITFLVTCAAGSAVRCARRRGGAVQSLGFGVLAGVAGSLSITATKLCWLLLDAWRQGGDNLFGHPGARDPVFFCCPNSTHDPDVPYAPCG